MKHIFLISLAGLVNSCASFPVPKLEVSAHCTNSKENNDYSAEIVFKPREDGSPYHDLGNKNFVEMNSQYLQNTFCFVSKIDENTKAINKKIIFNLSQNFEPAANSLPLFCSIFTLGIIPAWTKITTDLQVTKVDDERTEVEIFHVKHERNQILSIFISPIAIYRMIVAPSGLNALEAAQLETNKYVMGQAIIGLKEKGLLQK